LSVSVVLISRNQQGTIGRLIESVLRETAALDLRELILVDSASSDHTVEVARGWPVSVLSLPDSDWLCAAAGRFAGFAATTGEYVLFLDGDMELCEGWLASALRVLDKEPRVAAVAGRVLEPGGGAGEAPDWPVGEQRVGGEPGWDVAHPGGAAVYRRVALEQVGSFNPYLRADEEPELALRLRAHGYQIIALDRPSVVHHDTPANRFTALVARRRRGLFLGHGQVTRALLSDPPLLARYLRERGYAVAPAAVVLVLGSLAARRSRWLRAAVLLGAALLTADAVRRRSAASTAIAVVNRAMYIEGFFRGLFEPLGDPQLHPVTTQASWTVAPRASR
jgi:glycosyltransferase involved in cell wall biosynthesis